MRAWRRRTGQVNRMRRREFVTLLIAAAVPIAAHAQQESAIRRVGVLLPSSSDDHEAKNDLIAFGQQLQNLGWVEGRNLHVEYRWSNGDTKKMQAYAKELVAAQPDVLV